MAIPLRLEILADGPRSGVESVDPNLIIGQLDGVFQPGDQALELHWQASEVARIVEVKARLAGRLRYGCARCVQPLTFPVDISLSHHWVPPGSLDLGDDASAGFDRDPDVTEHDGVEIDLEPVVIECAVVEFPYAPDCDLSVEGRCPDWTDEARVLHPGGPAPEVPRKNPFAALADLKLSPDAEA